MGHLNQSLRPRERPPKEEVEDKITVYKEDLFWSRGRRSLGRNCLQNGSGRELGGTKEKFLGGYVWRVCLAESDYVEVNCRFVIPRSLLLRHF